MSAKNAASNSTHKFPWKWKLSDLSKVEKNGLNVFSCFSCGGGSSMGYKLAGFNVIGNCEIDPRVNALYQKNLHPRYSYEMDIREFVDREDLPEELYNLDILDGSPPCSVFSMAGKREDGWNKKKVFREGQAEQKLDDLFFYFIKLAKRLQPKIVVAENVKGLVLGNAKGYVNEIFKAFDDAGYAVQLFLLNAAVMGVPQKRERCFFIARRKDLQIPKLTLAFKETPIFFGEVRSEHGKPLSQDSLLYELLAKRRFSDRDVSDINKRMRGKNVGFTNPIISDGMIAPTLASGGSSFRMFDGELLSVDDCRNIQTFPQDYDFGSEDAKYVCGMSVPPVMMAHVADAIYKQIVR